MPFVELITLPGTNLQIELLARAEDLRIEDNNSLPEALRTTKHIEIRQFCASK